MQKLIPSSTPSTLSKTKIVIKVMIVSVPERPSTPSEQFVTLIDAHTRTIVRIANKIGGIVMVAPVMAMVIVLVL